MGFDCCTVTDLPLNVCNVCMLPDNCISVNFVIQIHSEQVEQLLIQWYLITFQWFFSEVYHLHLAAYLCIVFIKEQQNNRNNNAASLLTNSKYWTVNTVYCADNLTLPLSYTRVCYIFVFSLKYYPFYLWTHTTHI